MTDDEALAHVRSIHPNARPAEWVIEAIKAAADQAPPPPEPAFVRDLRATVERLADCLGQVRAFDNMIGRLDRILSEFLIAAETCQGPDHQTIKHHADDLIGVGKKALELLERGRAEAP